MAKKLALDGDAAVTELTAIKRLLVFAILKSGASQAEVAQALGVNQSQISRMFPKAGAKSQGR